MHYFLRRLAALVPVLFLTWSAVFFLFEAMPGDPVALMLGGVPASDTVIANERARLGLDRPVLERYAMFVARAATGDLGDSYRTRQPVTQMILDQLPATLQLAAGGLVVALVAGFTLGLAAGLRPGTWVDTLCTTLALGGSSMPSFFSGILLIYLFGQLLQWLPVVGTGLDALILPSIVTGMFMAGDFGRLIRTSLIEAQAQPYIRTARAKGLPPLKVIGKHALRNALIPPVTVLGLQLSTLIGGAVVTENVFARPGLGTMLVDAVQTKDVPLVQALVVYTTAAYLVVNLAVDLLYAVIDPRIASLRRTGA